MIGEKIAAVGRFFEVNLGTVAFALGIDRGIDASLGADGMRTFDGNEGNQIDGHSGFAQFDDGHEARETSADDDHSSNFSAVAPVRAFASHINPMLQKRRAKPVASRVRRLLHASFRGFFFANVVAGSSCGMTIATHQTIFQNSFARREVDDGIHAQAQDGDAHESKDPSSGSLGSFGDGDAPREAEAPKAVGEVVDTGGDAEDVGERDEGHAGVGRGHLFAEPGVEVFRGELALNLGQPQAVEVVADEQKGQEAGDALEGERPISRGAVFGDVVASFQSQLDAVACMKKQREENPGFEQRQVGHMVDVTHGGVE